jgi:hypothetical protein
MDWVKYIYERFFMRDLLGKIMPGSIELYAIVHLTGMDDILDVTKWHWPIWLLAAAASLVTALAFQTLAELVGLHSASPRPRRILFFFACRNWKNIYQDFRVRLNMFRLATTKQEAPDAAIERERFVYFKEASGNLGIAVLILLPVLFPKISWIAFALLLAFSILLLATHFIHSNRQAEYEIHFLWHKEVDNNATKRILETMANRLNIQLKDKSDLNSH